jgi:hypothetical protein
VLGGLHHEALLAALAGVLIYADHDGQQAHFSQEDLAHNQGDGTGLVLSFDPEEIRKAHEWKKLIRSRYPAKHMEIVNWLKAEHGMGHGHANALVGHTLAEDAE